MKSNRKYLMLLVILMSWGCSQNRDSSSDVVSDDRTSLVDMAPAQDEPSTQQMPLKKNHQQERLGDEEQDIGKKLIKDGVVAFRTNDRQQTRSAINQNLARYNGYVSTESSNSYQDRISNTIVIRVPAESFDSLLTDVTKGGKNFDTREITLKDVTAEFIDIQARLRTKKELELRYRDLLAKANTVKDILEIEKQSGELRSDIEAIEGRLRYLQNQIAYSTLTVTFYQIVPAQTPFKENFKTGFRNGWNNLIYFCIGLVNLWPFIVMGVAAICGIRLYRRKKRQKVE